MTVCQGGGRGSGRPLCFPRVTLDSPDESHRVAKPKENDVSHHDQLAPASQARSTTERHTGTPLPCPGDQRSTILI